MRRGRIVAILLGGGVACGAAGDGLETDLLVVGGSEAACAAAVQASRLGVARVTLVSDIDMLGGQYSAEGVGPVDERIKLNGHSANFPRSGLALEIHEAIARLNFERYGHATPGNCWSATDTVEPGVAAAIFEELLAPEVASGRLRVLRGYEPVEVLKSGDRVTAVRFRGRAGESLDVVAGLTVDASDWGDVIRLSGAGWFAGVDPEGRFREEGEPIALGADERQEMNPITWTLTLRAADRECPIERPQGYDRRSYVGGPFKDFGVLPETYPPGIPATPYSQRRLVDARNLTLAAGARDVIQLNTTEMDYPLCDLPDHVKTSLEANERGASAKNIVEMTPSQRALVFADARRRALGYLYFLQNDYPPATNVMRRMELVADFGTPDRLPPKPYVREGLRLDAMTVVTANDVRAADAASVAWAAVPADAAFGFQFHIDFHPTRRIWLDGARTVWRPRHVPGRTWDGYTHRAFFPLSGFVPRRMDGLLGAGKNIGVSSLVAAALRLHPQMVLSGQCAATLAAFALREKRTPRALVSDPAAVRRIQRRLVTGVRGSPGVAICPWQDLAPREDCFVEANLRPVAERWALGKSFDFRPQGYARDRQQSRMELLSGRLRSDEAPALKAADVRALSRGIVEEAAIWRSNPLAPGVDAARLDVSAFGAKGDGVADDSAAFVRALAAVRALRGRPAILRLGAGTFRLATATNDARGLRVHLDCANVTNLAVLGVSPEATRLVFADYDARGVVMRNARNLVFRNLDVSYEKTPFAQGVIESVDLATATVTIRHQPGTLLPDGPEFRRYWRKAGTIGQVCGVFTSDRRRIHSPNVFYRIDADDLGDGRYRLKMNGGHPEWARVNERNLPIGATLVIPDRGVGPAFDCDRAAWVDFVDVWVRNARAAAIIAYDGEYVSGVRVRVFPKREDLALSTNADAFYGSPGVYLNDCEFRNMNDDGGNCHMKAQPVLAKLGPHALVHRTHGGKVRPGEMLRLYHALDGSVAADLTIASTRWGVWKEGASPAFVTETVEEIPTGVITEADVPRPLSAEEWRMLEHGIPEEVPPVADLAFLPQGYGMGYVVKNCRFADFRGLGVNVQCPNACLASNRFERINVGIWRSAMLKWKEGILPYAVREEGNVFVDVPVARGTFVQALMPRNRKKAKQ